MYPSGQDGPTPYTRLTMLKNQVDNGVLKKIVATFGQWATIDRINCQFFPATLAVDIGEFKAGQQVDCVSILLLNVEKPKVEINLNGETIEFPLEVSFKFGEPVKVDW